MIRNQERIRLAKGGYLERARPSRKANLTIRILGTFTFGGKRGAVWSRLRDGMKVEDWCGICAPIFNTTSAGTYLLALYLEKKLITLG